jgi:restriction system protein
MGRRRSSFDDFMDLALRLPWYIGVALAVLSFLVFRSMAATLPPSATQAPGVGIGSFAARQLVATLAKFMQIVAPLGFLVGAIASLARRSQAKTLFGNAIGRSRRAIAEMSWTQFERLVGEAFRRRGFDVRETGGSGSGGDGGVDLMLSKNGERWLVQCKHWRSTSVGVSVIREVYGVITAQRAAGGYVVTSGGFTQEARRFAQDSGVELIDGAGLEMLIGKLVREPSAEEDRPSGATAAHDSPLPAPSIIPAGCPQCGAVMRKRVAKRGANAGTAFWGCSRYPNCRGTLPLG